MSKLLKKGTKYLGNLGAKMIQKGLNGVMDFLNPGEALTETAYDYYEELLRQYRMMYEIVRGSAPPNVPRPQNATDMKNAILGFQSIYRDYTKWFEGVQHQVRRLQVAYPEVAEGMLEMGAGTNVQFPELTLETDVQEIGAVAVIKDKIDEAEEKMIEVFNIDQKADIFEEAEILETGISNVSVLERKGMVGLMAGLERALMYIRPATEVRQAALSTFSNDPWKAMETGTMGFEMAAPQKAFCDGSTPTRYPASGGMALIDMGGTAFDIDGMPLPENETWVYNDEHFRIHYDHVIDGVIQVELPKTSSYTWMTDVVVTTLFDGSGDVTWNCALGWRDTDTDTLSIYKTWNQFCVGDHSFSTRLTFSTTHFTPKSSNWVIYVRAYGDSCTGNFYAYTSVEDIYGVPIPGVLPTVSNITYYDGTRYKKLDTSSTQFLDLMGSAAIVKNVGDDPRNNVGQLWINYIKENTKDTNLAIALLEFWISKNEIPNKSLLGKYKELTGDTDFTLTKLLPVTGWIYSDSYFTQRDLNREDVKKMIVYLFSDLFLMMEDVTKNETTFNSMSSIVGIV
jgi:hypothetical protein